MGQRAILNSLALLGLALQVVSGSSWGYNHASPSVLDPNEDNEQSIVDISSQLTNLKKLFEEFETVEKAILAGEKTQDKYDELLGSLKSEIESIDQLINGQFTLPEDRNKLDEFREEAKARLDENELQNQLGFRIEILDENIEVALKSRNPSRVDSIQSEIKSLKDGLAKAQNSKVHSDSPFTHFLSSAQDKLNYFESKLSKISHAKSSKTTENSEPSFSNFQTTENEETLTNKAKSLNQPFRPFIQEFSSPNRMPPLTKSSSSEKPIEKQRFEGSADKETEAAQGETETTQPESLNLKNPRNLASLMNDSLKPTPKATAPERTAISTTIALSQSRKPETNTDLGERPLQPNKPSRQLNYAPYPTESSEEKFISQNIKTTRYYEPQKETVPIEAPVTIEVSSPQQNLPEPKAPKQPLVEESESLSQQATVQNDSLAYFLKEQIEKAMTQQKPAIADSLFNLPPKPLKQSEKKAQPTPKPATASTSNWFQKLKLWLGV